MTAQSTHTNPNSTVGKEMSTNENTNQNTTVGNEMTSKQREIEEFKKQLSPETLAKLKGLTTKPQSENSNDTVSNTDSDTVTETSVVTAESKNPKYSGFKTALAPLFEETKKIMEEIYSKSIRATFNYIQIGNILTDAKKES